MSVTFQIDINPNKEYKAVTCDMPGCCREERCGYCEDGVYTDVVDLYPSINLANVSAKILADMLWFDIQDGIGSFTHAQLGTIRQRILRLRNGREGNSSWVTEPSTEKGEGGCRIYNSGYSEERLDDMVTRFEKVVCAAQELGVGIVWY